MAFAPFEEFEVPLSEERLVLLDPQSMHQSFTFSLRFGQEAKISESYGVISCQSIEVCLSKAQAKSLGLRLAFVPPLYLEFDDFTICRYAKKLEQDFPDRFTVKQGYALCLLQALSEQISVTLLKTPTCARLYARFHDQHSQEHLLTLPQLHWVYGTQAVLHGS